MEAPSKPFRTNLSRRGSLGLDAHRAVWQVLGVAGEPQPAGLALHRPSVADALHLAPDDRPQPQSSRPGAAHAWMVTGVPSGRVPARVLMAWLSMRTQPLETSRPRSDAGL